MDFSFSDEQSMLRDTLAPVNETLSEVQVELDLHQMAMWKFTIYSQMEKSFQMQVRAPDSLYLLAQAPPGYR